MRHHPVRRAGDPRQFLIGCPALMSHYDL
jgi:hypothetical protein